MIINSVFKVNHRYSSFFTPKLNTSANVDIELPERLFSTNKDLNHFRTSETCCKILPVFITVGVCASVYGDVMM